MPGWNCFRPSLRLLLKLRPRQPINDKAGCLPQPDAISMRVNPNSGLSSVTKSSTKSTGQSPSLGQDKLTLDSANALNAALQQTPDVRPDKLAQAQNLINDPKFPPDEIIRAISRLLASHINVQDTPDTKI